MINVLGRRNPRATSPVSVLDDEVEDLAEDADSNIEELGDISTDGPKQIKLKSKVNVRVQTIDDGKGNLSKGNKKKAGLAVERMKSRSIIRT